MISDYILDFVKLSKIIKFKPNEHQKEQSSKKNLLRHTRKTNFN